MGSGTPSNDEIGLPTISNSLVGEAESAHQEAVSTTHKFSLTSLKNTGSSNAAPEKTETKETESTSESSSLVIEDTPSKQTETISFVGNKIPKEEEAKKPEIVKQEFFPNLNAFEFDL